MCNGGKNSNYPLNRKRGKEESVNIFNKTLGTNYKTNLKIFALESIIVLRYNF